MEYTQGNAAELRDTFWKAMVASPFVLLQLDSDPASAAPMTAQLDADANSAIWFFTQRSNAYSRMGAAHFSYASKGHDLFARVHGVLSEEFSRERLDKQWSKQTEAWFPGGKDDPSLLMLRMDLGEAAIWNSDLGLINTARMLLGMDVTDKVKGQHADIRL